MIFRKIKGNLNYEKVTFIHGVIFLENGGRPKLGIGKSVKLTLSEEEWAYLGSFGKNSSQAIRHLLFLRKLDDKNKSSPFPSPENFRKRS